MKKNTINVLFLVSIIIFSCEEDVLDKKPLDVLSADAVWADINLGRLYVNELYSSLPGGIDRDLDCTTVIGEGNKSSTRVYAVGEVTANNSPFSDEWYSYETIARINLFLENFAPQNAENEEEVNRLRGEALFLRAFLYRELNDLFGGVPIIASSQTLTDDLLVGRNTYEQCVDFIVSDLDEAADLLPLPADTEAGRANKGAALALKSRVLLYAASPLHNPGNDLQKWEAASDAALDVINQAGEFGYDLYPDYEQVFLIDNHEEVIFDIQYQFPYRTTAIDYELNPQGLNGAFGNTRPTQNLVDSYEMSNGKMIQDADSGFEPDDPYAGRDERFYASVLYNGVTWRGVTVQTFQDGAHGPGANDLYNSGSRMTGYYIRKFLSQDPETNPVLFGDNRASQNWILIRYAEILLNYAEAQLALDNEGEARHYINMVRDRANQPDLDASVTGQELVDRYRNERKIELAFEEHHYFDIRRWKTAPDDHGGPVHRMNIVKNPDETLTYFIDEMEQRIWKDAYYYLPIPQDEIFKNPNLEQNDGYGQ
jgi:starch-binding outer membrane protein, SusD/RagB family